MKIAQIIREKLTSNNHAIISGRYKDASVFLLLTDEPETKIYFIQRSNYISSHAGEIGFPGGLIEKFDKSLIETAYRETYEEINLSRNDITFIGRLGHQLSHQGIRVTPYVGMVRSDKACKTKSIEVSDIYKIPLEELLEQPFNGRKPVTVKAERDVTDYFIINDKVIWGLTARILCDFFNHCFNKNFVFSRSSAKLP